MQKITKICILLSLTALCYTQLSFDQNGAHVRRRIYEKKSKTKTRLYGLISSYDDLILETLNTLTSMPIRISRMFGGEEDVLISDSNSMDLETVVAEFTAGIGNEDAVLNIEQLLAKYKYPLEKHLVATDDGYILTVFRIPSDGSVVFLMHGITGSADDFIMAGPESGLAYLLADNGFDVWMGNARGNKFSRQHTKLNPREAAFWDFSWHEIGYYDLPAMIDYILLITGKETINYIGHSQGTTSFFVMASERPQYNKAIEKMIALSPVAFLSHTKSTIIRYLAAGSNPLHTLARSTGMYEFFADTKLMRILKMLICGAGPLSEILCSNPILLFLGFSFEHLNVTNLPVVYGHTPSGSSAKQFAHYGQLVVSGDFRKYDYGAKKNMKLYGTKTAPSYDLSNVDVPIVLYYSNADWLAAPKDVDTLFLKLGKNKRMKEKHMIPAKKFNHMDFLLAKDFKTLVFPLIRENLGSAWINK